VAAEFMPRYLALEMRHVISVVVSGLHGGGNWVNAMKPLEVPQ
jgi:hypothetical protein